MHRGHCPEAPTHPTTARGRSSLSKLRALIERGNDLRFTIDDLATERFFLLGPRHVFGHCFRREPISSSRPWRACPENERRTAAQPSSTDEVGPPSQRDERSDLCRRHGARGP